MRYIYRRSLAWPVDPREYPLNPSRRGLVYCPAPKVRLNVVRIVFWLAYLVAVVAAYSALFRFLFLHH